ncbi:MAG: hypothetical protein NVSMB42_16080 [Herpetosiphon sp.]
MPEGGLTLSADGQSATLAMQNVMVIDQPKYPQRDPTTPAVMSFRVVWTATNQPDIYSNPNKQFAFAGHYATAKLEAEVAVPSTGFTWKSDPIETSSAKFARIGKEVNGKYYAPMMPNLVGYGENQAKTILGNLSITKVIVDYQGRAKLGALYDQFVPYAVVSHLPPAGTPVEPGMEVVLGVRAP